MTKDPSLRIHSFVELNETYPGALTEWIKVLTLIRGSEDDAIIETTLATIFTIEDGTLFVEPLDYPSEVFKWDSPCRIWVKQREKLGKF